MDLLVVSSHTRPSSTAPINHEAYCRRHGYRYAFDATPYPLATKFDQKLHAVLANLERAEWLLWLDDDAYVTDLGVPFERFRPAEPEVDLVFCDSPVDARGRWTVVNAGVFLVRRTEAARELLDAALHTDIAEVEAWWDPVELGYFARADQDRLIYQFVRRGLLGSRVRVLDHAAFNSRLYEYRERADEHFVLHLAGVQDKAAAIAEARSRFGLDPHLLPPGVGAALQPELGASMFYRDERAQPAELVRDARRVARRIAGAVRRRVS
jgi:hypothetical protein